MKPIRSCAAALGGALLAGALTAGCGLPLLGQESRLENTCSSDDDCGSSGVCLAVGCVSTKADLSGLLLQIDLPTSASTGAGSSTLIDPSLDGLSLSGVNAAGYWLKYDISVPAMQAVSGQLALNEELAPTECVAATASMGHTLPAKIRLYPSVEAVGVPLKVYETQAEDQGSQYGFALNIPSGSYDVYIVPQKVPVAGDDNQSCQLPPTLISGYQAGTSFNVSLGSPVTLSGTIAGNINLQGWTVDLVDATSGRVISSTYTLPEQALGSFSFHVDFWENDRPHALLRLTPPAEDDVPAAERQHAGMPVVVWHLQSADLDGDLEVSLSVSELEGTPIRITEGSVLDADGAGIPATIAIQSLELLSGEFGANAAFKTSVTTDINGTFAVTLLPGQYEVFALPSNAPTMAITKTTWKLKADDFGGGRVIQVNPKSTLVGQVTTSSGVPAYSIPTVLQPATSQAESYIEDVLLASEVPPASVTTLTDPGGVFSVDLDPGVFDLSIRPDADSGFPWLVRPRVTIQPREEAATDNLGTLGISNPIVLEGVVESETGDPIAGAAIYAWITPVSEGQTQDSRPTVIQIAESASNADGRYELRLPASVSQ